jgi:hypothetical protein
MINYTISDDKVQATIDLKSYCSSGGHRSAAMMLSTELIGYSAMHIDGVARYAAEELWNLLDLNKKDQEDLELVITRAMRHLIAVTKSPTIIIKVNFTNYRQVINYENFY